MKKTTTKDRAGLKMLAEMVRKKRQEATGSKKGATA